MSKKKHNVAYMKPSEPKFLRELKEQAGYKAGPTVETKRGVFPGYENEDIESDDERINPAEEEPVVVVLKNGDMTLDEVENYKKAKEEEELQAPADLSKRILFNRKSKHQDDKTDDNISKPKKKIKTTKTTKSLLSFDDDDNE
ncbi:hypothetical protein HCN44_000889 [Aphidius gifuensis]|uniref:DUF4604 domain-containing protein n=1 Tax=Aphidius gifuensis TaxID=684658 RepID=A0A834XK42_APHGI|nr:uncharacterized protein KIAA1143 homolog [Aphidius gifuensis]KAF7988316.1 hypothetical protein HCN44_000889 [Aphidius gifuensis]